jgi:beta-glucuronidase
MRLFKDHQRRDIQCLNGLWDFAFLGNPDERPAQYASRLAVPGCWDATVDHGLQRGVGWYRRTVHIEQAGRFLLRFDGVANEATVLLDGRQIAFHYGSHTTFRTQPVDLSAGEHELVVRADNRFGEHNTLLEYSCGWYCYGGIHRSVRLERIEDIRLEHLHVVTTALDDRRATLQANVDLSLGDLWNGREQLSLSAGETQTISREITVDGVDPWSPDTPALYEARAVCGQDDLIERFGIRTIRCENGQLLLNNQPLRLRGVNHHDYHPESGYTSDLLRMKQDLDLVRRLGLNFVRTSHYPKDRLFLDLCDEMGLLVLEEATGWQNGPDMMRTERFVQQLTGCIDEMITEHINHPCIIIWGLLNEVRSEYDDLRGVFESAIGRIRQLDPSRPVTYATNRLLFMPDKPDRMLDLVDILCPNLYNRWYEDIMGPQNANPADFLARQIEWFDQQGLGGKPIVIGEFGAGGQAGYHRLDRRRWSEQMQCDILTEALEVFHNHPRVSGYAIWLLADTACSESEELKRPYSHNCKGLLDAHRNPKLAFYRVADFLAGAPD